MLLTPDVNEDDQNSQEFCDRAVECVRLLLQARADPEARARWVDLPEYPEAEDIHWVLDARNPDENPPVWDCSANAGELLDKWRRRKVCERHEWCQRFVSRSTRLLRDFGPGTCCRACMEHPVDHQKLQGWLEKMEALKLRLPFDFPQDSHSRAAETRLFYLIDFIGRLN